MNVVKYYWIVHFKMINFMQCEFHLKKKLEGKDEKKKLSGPKHCTK